MLCSPGNNTKHSGMHDPMERRSEERQSQSFISHNNTNSQARGQGKKPTREKGEGPGIERQATNLVVVVVAEK